MQALLRLSATEALTARRATCAATPPGALAAAALAHAQHIAPLAAYTATLRGAEQLGAALRQQQPPLPTSEERLLDGLPVAVKDNFCTLAPLPTTCASRMLAGFVAPYEATVVARLRRHGALVVGKTNMDEFGMGSASTHSHFGAVRNPWDETRIAGGSSGGSAVAVATCSAFGALGSDTGGSIRMPAVHCGVVGFKPSYGRLSRWGMVAYASSLDTPALVTRSVPDAALFLRALSGADPNDATCMRREAWTPRAEHCLDAGLPARASLRGLRVGLPREFHVEELSSEIRDEWERCAQLLREAGATVVPVSLPHTRLALSAYYVLACAEASSNLARYDGVRYGERVANPDNDLSLEDMYCASRSAAFGTEVKRRIMLGTFVLSKPAFAGFYQQAGVVRSLVIEDFAQVLGSSPDLPDNHPFCDVLLTPVTPSKARLIADAPSPADEYVQDVMTVPPNLAGLPSLSVPTGFWATSPASPHRLPLGMQLIAAREREDVLLSVGRVLHERAGAAGALPPRWVPGEGAAE